MTLIRVRPPQKGNDERRIKGIVKKLTLVSKASKYVINNKSSTQMSVSCSSMSTFKASMSFGTVLLGLKKLLKVEHRGQIRHTAI